MDIIVLTKPKLFRFEVMERNSRNSRGSNYSKPVVFPRIENERKETGERHPRPNHTDGQNLENQSLGDRRSLRSKSPRYGQGSSNDFRNYVLEKLEFTESVLEEERRSRNLLEDHLRSVVGNVQRMSKDMAMLQQQVRSDEDNGQSRSLAMKNLEMHQVAGIGDVWNRLTLGDLNSIKLAGDLNKVASEVSDLKRSEEDMRRKIKKLQGVVDGLMTKIEGINVEFGENIQSLRVLLETQNRSIEDKIKNTQNNSERVSNVNLDEKVEEHCSALLGNVQHRLDAFLETHKLQQEAFEARIEKLEEKFFKVIEMKGRKDEDLVRKFQEVSTHQTTAFQKSQQKLKDGYREAFKAVYESITMVQTVLEAKLKLTEADLKTSINSILKTISHS